MRYRMMGQTGLKVSELCLGTMTFGSAPGKDMVPGSDEAESRRVLDTFLEQGGNFIDTADGYSDSRSEEILGRGLKGKRDSVVLATKVFFPSGATPNEKGLSRKHIMEAVEASLRRLQTDRIDLYQVHCFDSHTPLEETLSTLDMLVRQGKVLYLGCSNFAGWQLAKALGISAARGWARFDCLQPQYSIVCRSIERELLPLCREEGVGVIPWRPLGGGFLSGKYQRGQSAPDASRLAQANEQGKPWTQKFLTERNFSILEVVQSVAKELSKSLVEVSLAWLLEVRGVTSVIIGARNTQQLRENLGAGGWVFPRALWEKIDIASALPDEYPQDFHRFVEGFMHGDVA